MAVSCKVYLTRSEYNKLADMVVRGEKVSTLEKDAIISSWLIDKMKEYEPYTSFLSARNAKGHKANNVITLVFFNGEEGEYEEKAETLGITWRRYVQRLCYSLISAELETPNYISKYVEAVEKKFKEKDLNVSEQAEESIKLIIESLPKDSWKGVSEELNVAYNMFVECCEKELDRIKAEREEEERKKKEEAERLEMCRRAYTKVRELQDQGFPLDIILSVANEMKAVDVLQEAFLK